MATYERHHVWCNDNNGGRSVNCWQCAGLYADYPHDPLASASAGDGLLAKHFPNVKKVGEPPKENA